MCSNIQMMIVAVICLLGCLPIIIATEKNQFCPCLQFESNHLTNNNDTFPIFVTPNDTKDMTPEEEQMNPPLPPPQFCACNCKCFPSYPTSGAKGNLTAPPMNASDDSMPPPPPFSCLYPNPIAGNKSMPAANMNQVSGSQCHCNCHCKPPNKDPALPCLCPENPRAPCGCQCTCPMKNMTTDIIMDKTTCNCFKPLQPKEMKIVVKNLMEAYANMGGVMKNMSVGMMQFILNLTKKAQPQMPNNQGSGPSMLDGLMSSVTNALSGMAGGGNNPALKLDLDGLIKNLTNDMSNIGEALAGLPGMEAIGNLTNMFKDINNMFGSDAPTPPQGTNDQENFGAMITQAFHVLTGIGRNQSNNLDSLLGMNMSSINGVATMDPHMVNQVSSMFNKLEWQLVNATGLPVESMSQPGCNCTCGCKAGINMLPPPPIPVLPPFVKKDIKQIKKSIMTVIPVANRPVPSNSDCGRGSDLSMMEVCLQPLRGVLNVSTNNEIDGAIRDQVATIQSGIMSQDNDIVNRLTGLCGAGSMTDDCLKSLKQVCSGAGKTVQNFMKTNQMGSFDKQFCKDGAVSEKFSKKFTSSQIGNCLTSPKGEKLVENVKNLASNIYSKMSQVDNSMFIDLVDVDISSTTNSTLKLLHQRARAVCGMFQSAANKGRKLMRQFDTSQCDDDTKLMLMDQLMMTKMDALDQFCTIPDIGDAKQLKKKGNNRDSKRINLILFGANHILVYNASADDFITCAGTENESSIFEYDTVAIKGTISKYEDSAVPNNVATYLADLTISFMDASFTVVDELVLPATTAELSGTFTDGTTTKLNGNIRIEKKSSMNIVIKDVVTGMFLSIRKFNVKGATPFYNLFIRAPESVVQLSSGSLVEGCINNRDILTVSASRRRKRSPASECKTDDINNTGSTSSGEMSNNAASDAAVAESNDSSFSSSNTIFENSLATLLLVAAFVRMIIA